MENSFGKKVLIIRLTSLGDVIFTVPLACTLKNSGQFSQVGWLVAEKGLEVVKGNPCVDKCHFVPLKEWKKRPFSPKAIKEFWNLISELRAEKYDIALDCQQMFKNLFLFLFCGAKRRITFKDARELSVFAGNEFVKPKAKFRDNNYHIVERNLDFARHLGIEPEKIEFALPETSTKTKQKVDELLSNLDEKPIVVISPATTWKNKHWDVENWAKLVSSLYEKTNLIFTGTEQDKKLIEEILDKSDVKSFINLAGLTNVEELREVFSRSKIVISPDSGSAHLAWASSNPTVIAIFTCTPKNRFGPYGNSEKYFSVSSNLPCQPCFKKKCKLKSDKNICTKTPDAAEIMNIVNKLLD